MAFGNKGVVDNSKQEQLREKRKSAMFSSDGAGGSATTFPKNTLVNVPMDLIDPNPDNEKVFNMDDIEALAAHIRDVGYDNASPVSLFEKPDGRYELSAGHRRYEACKMNGAKTIPAIIKADIDSADKAKALLDSNMYNRVLKFYDYTQAIVYYRDNYLIPSGYAGNVREALCEYFHMTDTSLQRYLSILKLIPELQELTKNIDFPSSVLGKAVKMSTELQYELYEEICKVYKKDREGEEGRLTARQLTEIIDMVKRRDIDRQRIASQKAMMENSSQIEQPIFSGDGSTIAIHIDDTIEEDGPVRTFKSEVPVYSGQKSVVEKTVEIEDVKPAATEKRAKKQESTKTVREKKKPDVTVAVNVLNTQISAIDLNDFAVGNKDKAEKLIINMIEKLNELLLEIKGSGN